MLKMLANWKNKQKNFWYLILRVEKLTLVNLRMSPLSAPSVAKPLGGKADTGFALFILLEIHQVHVS